MHVCGKPNAASVYEYAPCDENVIVAALADMKAFEEINSRLTPEHFTGAGERVIFAAMQRLWAEDVSIAAGGWDFVEIARAVATKDEDLGPHYRDLCRFVSLAKFVKQARPTGWYDDSEHWPWRSCVATFEANFQRTKIANLGRRLQQIEANGGDVNVAAQMAREMLEAKAGMRGEDVSSEQLVSATVASIESKAAAKIVTTVHVIDSVMGGLGKGTLNVIAGRPGAGKTSFAVHVFRRFALAGGRPVFFSMEMLKEEIGMVLIAQHSGLSTDKMAKRDLTEAQWSRLTDAASAIHGLPMDTRVHPGMKLEEFASLAQAAVDRGASMILLDYIQLLSTTRAFKSKYDAVSHITGEMKQLALRWKIPVIALSQMNREIEKEGKRRWPRMADLRDSGTIEQDADSIAFLCFDPRQPMPPDEQETVMVTFFCVKNRSGRIGSKAYEWRKASREIVEPHEGGF